MATLDNVNNIRSHFHKPSLNLRVQSMLIDSVVVVGLMFLANTLLTSFEVESEWIRGLCLLAVILYEPIGVCLNATIGQMISGIRVRNEDAHLQGQERKLNFATSLLRYITKLLLGIISLFTIHSDAHGRAIHDQASGSVMIFS